MSQPRERAPSGSDDLPALSRDAAFLAERLASLARAKAFPPAGAGLAPPVEQLVRIAREELRLRRLREKMLPAELFADPAWDILLDLFIAYHHREEVYMSAACSAAPVPLTTALRWIGKLEAFRLIERRADPIDGRRIYVSLAPDAERAMAEWLAILFASYSNDFLGWTDGRPAQAALPVDLAPPTDDEADADVGDRPRAFEAY